jgi:hypothetical protein
MKYSKYRKKKLIFPIAFGLLLLFCSLTIAHRYYFSLSELKVDTQKKGLELSCKLFTDDIEDALLKLNHSKVDLATSTKNKAVLQQVETYLHERFKIVINGIPIQTHLIGFEAENEVTWFYLEGSMNVTLAPVKIKITNTLLYDFLPDQTNLLHFTWNDQERMEKLTNPDKEIGFDF